MNAVVFTLPRGGIARIRTPVSGNAFSGRKRTVERERRVAIGVRCGAAKSRPAALHLLLRRQFSELRCQFVPLAIRFAHFAPHALGNRIELAQTVEHCSRDNARRVVRKRRPAPRIERIDGANQSEAAFTDQIVEVAAGNQAVHATRDLLHERKKPANLLFALLAKFRAHVYSSSPARIPLNDSCAISPYPPKADSRGCSSG